MLYRIIIQISEFSHEFLLGNFAAVVQDRLLDR